MRMPCDERDGGAVDGVDAPAWHELPNPAPHLRLTEADLAPCREGLRHGSRTFLAASLLLPAEVRDSACALYAFCRHADDAVDNAADGPSPSASPSASPQVPSAGDAVQQLNARVAALYAGTPGAQPCDRALAAVVRRHAIPQRLLRLLLEGFAWDRDGRRYDTLAGLEAYALRVAGTVGAMMALIMGVRSPLAIERACDLGVAMQLSNIARDVGEDACNGRVYLPLQWLREAGIDTDAWLAAPQHSPALAEVVARLLRAAAERYRRADAGIALLPRDCRPAIRAASRLYAEIGHQVERNGLDSVSQRAVVPASRKLRVLGAALRAADLPGHGQSDPAGDSAVLAAPLIEAVQSVQPRIVPGSLAVRAPAWWDVPGRMVWVIDLFDRLERDERQQRRERVLGAAR